MVLIVIATPLAVGNVVKRLAGHDPQRRFVEGRMLPVDNVKFDNLILVSIQYVPHDTPRVGSILYGDQSVVIINQSVNTL